MRSAIRNGAVQQYPQVVACRQWLMMAALPVVWLLPLLVLLGACQSPKPEDKQREGICYAKGFRLESAGTGGQLLTVVLDSASGLNAYYVCGEGNGQLQDSVRILPPSPKRIVCLSTTHIGFLAALGAADRIVGVSGVDWVSSPEVRKRIDAGLVEDVGPVEDLNIERILALKPDLVVSYSLGNGDPEYAHLWELGVPVLMVNEFREEHPLGRAEWVKVFGFLTQSQEQADLQFMRLAKRYDSVAEASGQATSRPTVLLNAPWKECWYIPGTRSYMARLVEDAGGRLLTAGYEDGGSHSVNFEVALGLGMQANFWLNPGSYQSLGELAALHPAYAGFPSVERRNVYNNTKRLNPSGGNDFYERGVMEPDVLLEDLQWIFHPELAPPGYDPVYYVRLR